MKYIVRKVIKGNTYYYLQYQTYSKHLGSSLPMNLAEELFKFFVSISIKKYDLLSENIKYKFRFGDLATFETAHYAHIALKHDLLKGNYDRFYEQLIKLFTYHSNRSEGSKTTKNEIDLFTSSNNRKPRTKTDREIYNSFLAFKHAFSPNMKWNMKHIKHIHALLLDELDPMIAGKWKTENNIVGQNQITTDYKDVYRSMKKLVDWLKGQFKKKDIYPPELALQFYCRFEQIHPFLDGNGRVGRILLNALLHRFDYPPVVFFSENYKEHSTAIQYALEGRWGKMYKHFLLQFKKTDVLLYKFLWTD